jgi:myosin heavy subunit
MVKLNAEMGRLKSMMSLMPTVVAGTPQSALGEPSTGIPAKKSPEVAKLQTELREARQNYEQALAQVRSLDERLERLQKDTVELAALKSERASTESKASSTDRLSETEAALRRANEEITRLRQEHSVQMTSLSSQQAQIRELTDKLISQKENLERHTDLLATTREIRDLMGARNLHIIDVADVDSRGTRKPFGRVFYTEGKSLVFYAYDLEKKKKSMERFCFQAWGQVESRTGSVQSLGVFSTDDQAQNRWVLKYDDPSVLARIDSVFVTVEPIGGSMKPKGQQLMYAYLKANPNHP